MLTEDYILCQVYKDWEPIWILLSYDKEIGELMYWDPFNLEVFTTSQNDITLHVWKFDKKILDSLKSNIWLT